MKRVYIAYTGGTIGMDEGPDGYAPRPGFLEAQMKAMPELIPDSPASAYTLHEYDPLLDSSNVTPERWVRMARDIAANYEAFDGFVVIHGTDTMAYTASALAFLLEGLAKPVIVTGSQIPLREVRNDARVNLITSLQIAGGMAISGALPEVCICFGSRLLRGCRAVKVSADGFQAFDSPNFPPLGACGVDIQIDWKSVRGPGQRLEVREIRMPQVAALRIFPGISAGVVANILQPPLEGLVLETYGAGNIPDRDPALLAALRAAADRGVVIVNVTQCLKGAIEMGGYATGSALQKSGVVSGRDMTAEAALTKLFYLLGRGLPGDDVKSLMQQNLRGELT